MKAQGATVADVARTAKVPATTLYSFVAGKSNSLTGATQDRIAHAYGSSVADIFGGVAGSRIVIAGVFGSDGELHPNQDAAVKKQRPAWLGDVEGLVACCVGDLDWSLAEPKWLLLFRGGRLRYPDIKGAFVLADLSDGRRMLARSSLIPTQEADLERLDGTGISLADVSTMSLLFAVCPPPDRGP
jgi:hypothetical protein